MAKKYKLEKLFINSFLVGNQSQRNSGQMSLRAVESGDGAPPLPQPKSVTPITCQNLGPIDFDFLDYNFDSNLMGDCFPYSEPCHSHPPLICPPRSTFPLVCLAPVQEIDPVLKPLVVKPKYCTPPPVTIDQYPALGGELGAGLGGGAGDLGGGDGPGDWYWDSDGCNSDDCFTDDGCVSNNTCADCVSNGPSCYSGVCPTHVNCESEGLDGICHDSHPPICYLP